mgnify:CR=1 FL=1
MARTVELWVATRSDDQRVPRSVRLRLHTKFGARCAQCGRPIGEGQLTWDLDHIIPLARGGIHGEGNLRPLCRASCHRDKTRDDAAALAIYRKSEMKRAGIKKRGRTMGYRRFDGTPVHPKDRT